MSDKERIHILRDGETWGEAFTRLSGGATGLKREVRPLPEVKTLRGGGEAVTPDGRWGMVRVEGSGWDLISLPDNDLVALNLPSLDSCRRRILEIDEGA